MHVARIGQHVSHLHLTKLMSDALHIWRDGLTQLRIYRMQWKYAIIHDNKRRMQEIWKAWKIWVQERRQIKVS